MKQIPSCPECGEPLYNITKICTYVRRVNLSTENGNITVESEEPEFVSVDDYECGRCYSALPLTFDDFLDLP